MLRDEEVATKIISDNLLDSQHYSDKTLRRIFNKVKNYYIKYYKLPTKKTIKIKLFKNIEPEDRIRYKNLINKFYKLKLDGIKDNFDVIIDELDSLKQARTVQRNIVKVARSFKSQDYKRGVDLYLSLKEDLELGGSEVDEGDYAEDYDERREKVEWVMNHPEDLGYVKCTIPLLKGQSIYTADVTSFGKEVLDGGFWPGELTILVGASGTGKSFSLQQMGVNAAFHGSNVLAFTIEMMKNKLQTRVDTQITGIPFSKFKLGRLNDKELLRWEGRINTFKEKCGKYYVVGFPKGCTVGMIEAKMLQMSKQFNINFVTIDYMNDMSPSGRTRYATPQDWQAQGEISWDLKQLTQYWNDKKGIHILTANQGKKTSVDKEFLGEGDVAFSPQPYRHATTVLSISSKVSKEKDLRYLVWRVSKHRDGESERTYFTLPDFAKGKASIKPKWEEEEF